MILPYYKIERTEEGKRFFYSNFGYFNFWDEYLIMNIKEGRGKVFTVLVNRTGKKFSNPEQTEDCKVIRDIHIKQSVRLKKPKEMFNDFPELNNIRFKW